VNEQTTQKEISVSGAGEKKGDRTKRAEIWSFWLLREPQFNLDHYELRYANPFGVTWSEKCCETANKAVESWVYIKVNMKTSNEHYVRITGT